jgi:hypothetical protein
VSHRQPSYSAGLALTLVQLYLDEENFDERDLAKLYDSELEAMKSFAYLSGYLLTLLASAESRDVSLTAAKVRWMLERRSD